MLFFLSLFCAGVLWQLWWSCDGAMFWVINGMYYMVSGMAVLAFLMLSYVAVRLGGTVDMTVPEIQLLLGPSGLRKKFSCLGFTAGRSLVIYLQLHCFFCDCYSLLGNLGHLCPQEWMDNWVFHLSYCGVSHREMAYEYLWSLIGVLLLWVWCFIWWIHLTVWGQYDVLYLQLYHVRC